MREATEKMEMTRETLREENQRLKKEQEDILNFMEFLLSAMELWARSEGLIPSGKDPEKEFEERKREVLRLFHKLIKTSEPSFLAGLSRSLNLPENLKHFF